MSAGWDGLLTKQREHEDNAMAAGAKRFRESLLSAQQSGQGSTAGAARKLLQDAIVPLENAITQMIEESKGKRGARPVALKWCELIGADVAAYMTTKAVLDMLSKRVQVRRVALTVAEMLLDELRFRRLKETAPELFDYRMGKFSTSSYTHMARSLNATVSYAEVDVSDLEMRTADRILLGVKLIDMLIETTGLVERENGNMASRGKRQWKEVCLVPTQETVQWMTARNAALEFLRPVNLPMVVPPLQWTQHQRGGYRFALRGKYPFVRGITKVHAKTVKTTEMPAVYAAVNRIQETAWRINLPVLSLIQDIHLSGAPLGGIPSGYEEELPARPQDIAENEEARKAWRKKAHAVRERNHMRRIKSLEFTKVLATALSVQNEQHIFFPFNVDFRGRIYPISTYLNPQGNDLSKALLTFAQGKPLGSDGARWLATHGANCLGETPDGQKISRLTLQERVDWVVQHTLEIERVASDPLSHTWWAKADDPLQFYAFCVEWAGYAKAQRAGAGEEYVCSLPCAMDGSCNGLQHFSAMLRDEIGAEAVNVAPNERPQDIYQRIADVVLRMLEQQAGHSDFAVLWIKLHREFGLINRKITKRPTMTFGYGSKRFGFRQQIIDDLKTRENAAEMRPLFLVDNGSGGEKSIIGPAAGYLSGLIWDALREVVVAAFGGMAWMQKAARGVVQSGKCVTWTVPATGFRVRQEYMEERLRRVNTVLCGSVYRPAIYETTDKVNLTKQANAVAPNFVHSLDAAALMMTVGLAADNGVESFAMVHDSYGTLPADCAVLARATRQAFYALYTQHDVVGDLYRQLLAQADTTATEDRTVPAPPMPGNLDLSGVLVSDYFFA